MADETDETEELERARTGGLPRVEISLDELEKLARLHCTVAEAGSFFKCSKLTLQRYLEQPEFADTWQQGHKFARLSLRRLQWRHVNASGAGAVQMTIHLSKHWLGESEKVLNEVTGKDGPVAMRYVVVLPDNGRDEPRNVAIRSPQYRRTRLPQALSRLGSRRAQPDLV